MYFICTSLNSKETSGNYRPVSLTSVPCKVMESLLKDELTKYVETTSMLSKVQHGFCQGRSCLTNFLETFEAWTLALDQGYGIDVVYLDYRKAFDTVWHSGLLTKIQGYGVEGQLLAWIKSFLQGRRSDWVDVSSGVPRGSVLGPLLFLIFVNDISEWIKSNVKMFADNSKVWTRISTLRDGEVLQDDLNNLMSWSDKWKLEFNPEKCKVMHIGHSKNKVQHECTRESLGVRRNQRRKRSGNNSYQQLETKSTVC